MKTRRKYGSKQRMTINSNGISTRDAQGRKDQTTLDPPDSVLGKESIVFHKTRSQKLAKVNGQQEDHAETKEPLSNTTEFSSSSNRVTTRSTARPAKRQRKTLISPQSGVQQEALTASKTQKAKGGKKQKRQWESWGLEDKNAFFDALHEHGKDFDKIQVILQTRHKRRGDPKNLIKNKDQVRHFYYRTLNKISKYVPKDKQFTTETDPHQKTVLELRSLTCFGELRKRVCGLGEKQGKKLHELLEYGWTTIRQGGRNVRLKAPTCRALKKLTLGDSLYDESSNQQPPVPPKLDIEFIPLDNATWIAVQSLSKNPRLKTTVSSKKPLSLIIAFLAKKWPVKSSKPNQFLTLCIAIPVEYWLPEEAPQKDGTDATVAAGQPKDVPMETISSMDLLKDKEIQNTTSSNTNVNDTVNSSQNPVICVGKSVAGPTEEPTCKFWTLNNCRNITIGDIYCKLQRPPKLKLEYLFQVDESSPVKHSQNALIKLVDVAKTEFSTLKKRSSKTAASNADSNAMPAPAVRTVRIVPKATERLPFILPSVVQPAARHVYNQPIARQIINPTSTGSPSSSNNTISMSSFSHTRKRRRTHQPVCQSSNIIQRKLLPRPVNAMPRGAVAVSFIQQPAQTGSPVPSPVPVPVNENTTSTLSPKQGNQTGNSTAVASTSLLVTNIPSPPQASTLPPLSSPSLKSNIITTVLETGIQQPHTSSATVSQDILGTLCATTQDSITVKSGLPTSLNEITSLPSTTVTLPEVDHLINTLHNFTPHPGTNGLDSDVAVNSVPLQLDPVVSINEDSSSELLASIMGLTTTAQTIALPSVSDTQDMTDKPSTEGVTQELSAGIAGSCSVSYSTTSLIDMLSSTTETTSTFATGATKGSNLFNENTSEKIYLSPPHSSSAIFTSPQTSPLRMTSPTPDHQWLNGESSDISLSFLDKLHASPEKEPKFSFDLPSVPLFKDSQISQDSLFSAKPVTETAQAERAFRAFMDENSVDLVKKFQDLTKQLTTEDKTSSSESITDPSYTSGVLSFKNLISKQDH